MRDIEADLTPQEKGKAALCAAALETLLETYGCSLVAVPYIEDGIIATEIHVMPKQ